MSVEGDHFAGSGGEDGVVGRAQQRGAGGCGGREDVRDELGVRLVLLRRRLIEHHERSSDDEGPSHRNALTLAAGQEAYGAAADWVQSQARR